MSEQDKRAGLRRYHADECCKSGWEDAQFYLCSEADAALAQARREALDLLREYGRHAPGCIGEFPPHECKCGWAEVEARLLSKGETDG